MKRILISIFRALFGTVSFLLTGGKFGPYSKSKHSYEYSKAQEQKRKDFREFGGKPCKICGTRITGNRSYCGPCWGKYGKK